MQLEEIREKFPITRNYNFQNHAAIAPMSAPAAEALIGYARELSEAAYLRGNYYRAAERVRSSAAKLINADPGEVTFVKNTCEGINYIANGVQWLTRDNVVTTAMEFPANLYPWLALEQRGVRVLRVEDEDPLRSPRRRHQQPHPARHDLGRPVVQRAAHGPDPAG